MATESNHGDVDQFFSKVLIKVHVSLRLSKNQWFQSSSIKGEQGEKLLDCEGKD